TEVLRNENIFHQNIINNLPSRQACKEMIVFVDTIKRLLNDDHGAQINQTVSNTFQTKLILS
ncbi:unnamed protein product, partial [Rotaria sp. Silwood2]